jgi:hypothetical protein
MSDEAVHPLNGGTAPHAAPGSLPCRLLQQLSECTTWSLSECTSAPDAHLIFGEGMICVGAE